jgi:hypothetical protein
MIPAKHWRDRAAEMRALTSYLECLETIRTICKLADEYDKMADKREKEEDKPKLN